MKKSAWQIGLVWWLAMGLSNSIQGQQLPVGSFLSDSIKVGERVKYALSFKHPTDMEVYFPDSTHDFSPFEMLDKRFFPTQTDSTGSLDSVVYTFTTFELDPVQYLAVPALVSTEKEEPDVYNPIADSIYLVEVIAVVPDSVALKENTTWAIVKGQFNYPYLFIGLGSVAVLLLLGYLAFGKQIRKQLTIKRLRKKHMQFMQRFDQLVESEKNQQTLSDALAVWKNYTGSLIGLPLSSYTTKEIQGYLSHNELNQSLRALDRAVYAGRVDEQIKEKLVVLRSYTLEKFGAKVEEVKNG